MKTQHDIHSWLVEKLSARGPIDATAPFSTQGLSSKDAVAMMGQLGEWLGLPLSPALVFNYPTVATLAEHLATQNTTGDEDIANMTEEQLEEYLKRAAARV